MNPGFNILQSLQQAFTTVRPRPGPRRETVPAPALVEIVMPARLGLAAAATVGGALALLGLLTMPVEALTAWAVIAVCAGPLVALYLHITRRDSGDALRVGAATSAVMLAASLIIAGLIALLGAAAALVVPLLFAAAATWVWRRHTGPDRSAAAPTPPPRWAVSTGKHRPAGRPVPRLPDLDTGIVPTAVLCAAWQRTYWLLRDMPPTSPDHAAVIDIRMRLLDEFERRDPAGFTRWLDTEPRACSHPGRYLSVDHRHDRTSHPPAPPKETP